MTKLIRLFHKACAEYSLLEDGDRVLVALSGGKDSLMLTRLMGMQQRIHKPKIEVEAVHVTMDNIPYETDRSYIQTFCEQEGIRLTILHSSFEVHSSQFSPCERSTCGASDYTVHSSRVQEFKVSQTTKRLNDQTTKRPDDQTPKRPNSQSNQARRRQKTPCFLCSWNRRKAIFTYAKEHGFTKVALGHHQDDILITMLMNMTFEGTFDTMQPKLKMRHYPIEVIHPLCLIPEKDIKEQAMLLGFEKQKTPCPYDTVTKRNALKDVFHQLESLNPEARYSMWHALWSATRKASSAGEGAATHAAAAGAVDV